MEKLVDIVEALNEWALYNKRIGLAYAPYLSVANEITKAIVDKRSVGLVVGVYYQNHVLRLAIDDYKPFGAYFDFAEGMSPAYIPVTDAQFSVIWSILYNFGVMRK